MALDVFDERPKRRQPIRSVGRSRRARSEALVVLPTYNERENLASLVGSVVERGYDVLIIDDNSPDGTGELADQIASTNERVDVVHRPAKLGLGSAYVLGFNLALDRRYNLVVEMDADGSHQIDDLDALVSKAAFGLAIGSRYVRGGGTSDRRVHRRLLTRAANLHCRLMLGSHVRDWTSGFRCYSTRALRTVGLDGIISEGFSFQIEMAHRCVKAGVPVFEVPIQFKERTAGRSKASVHEVMQAFRCVTQLGLEDRLSDISQASAHDAEASPVNSRHPEPERRRPPPFKHPLSSAVIGVLAYNEEATIETCLRAILDEPLVRSVVLVASGCSDSTEEIANEIAARDPRVRVIAEDARTGKAAAINLLLRATSEPVVVVVAGDVIFTPGSLARLVEPFVDPSVGMTGCRPVPTNPRSGIVGNAVNLLWDLHHEVSLSNPKMGEAIAFRRVLTSIDDRTLVDEASMEKAIQEYGLVLRYVPEAIVRNHGPETIREFIAQRSRVCRGHLSLQSATGYQVSSMSTRNAARATVKLLRDELRPLRYVLMTLALEAVARMHAYALHLSGLRSADGKWKPIPTSKRVVGEGHMLRAHYDARQVLVIPSSSLDGQDLVGFAAVVRSKLRREDRLTASSDFLKITFRGNQRSKQSISGRLEMLLTSDTGSADSD